MRRATSKVWLSLLSDQFSDATSTTQGKYANVTTTGNFVWDPNALQDSTALVARRGDDLPAFAALTSDEDRERKAETRPPGTFSVITVPESFSNLPEYAAFAQAISGRRPSTQSTQDSVASPTSSDSRSITSLDVNTVVLDRFEDAISPTSSSFPPVTSLRSPGIPAALQRLSISAPVPISTVTPGPILSQAHSRSDQQLVAHFRQHIAPRLLQPVVDNTVTSQLVHGSTRDLFLLESARFTPLHHAICAISALNLSNTGRFSLEAAHQHYQHALSATATPTTADDLLSDGVFLRHLLLLIYDVCVPMDTDQAMWAQHLVHLRTKAVQRHQRLGREPHGYLLWLICELDMYACLLGNGTCEFVQTMLHHNMLPTLDQQIPSSGTDGPYLPTETHILPPIQQLNEGVLLHTVKLAQLAHACRTEASQLPHPTPESTTRWQTAVSRLQSELVTFWTQTYPPFLGPDSSEAGRHLPPRPRHVFEHAFLLYQTAIIYSRTSMFPSQRLLPLSNQQEIHHDTERRCHSILTLADEYVPGTRAESGAAGADTKAIRHLVLPLFIAGVATSSPETKTHAIHSMKAMESTANGAIGQNTYRTRQLLTAVCEEQRRAVERGRRMEEVDWFALGREEGRGWGVVNCGL
ncbi:hypothetical protein LTR62_005517 [Meristemomyces frigidus]|uniref:Uncharacterized protein n=1 Tax=Meristemomyces frigidus TaxID=1508187 RepID=A0AAN7TKS1_9PEZI|nr:hypothetical protein LTR62_005517 [Meristemomyces frigidus]